MDPFSAAILVAGGAVAYRLVNRSKKHAEWKAVLTQAAEKMGGRASPGSRFDAPELRVTVDQIMVNVSIKEAHKAHEHNVGIAEAKVNKDCEKVRVYIGWDITKIRKELEYIPKITDVSIRGLDGKLTLRADDKDLLKAFLRHAVNDLSSVRAEAQAHGLEILIRGGTLRIAVHGVDSSVEMVERLVTATTRLVRGLNYFASENPDAVEPAKAPPPVKSDVTCSLCMERKKDREKWVRCNRCFSSYHNTCWVQATGCLVDNCQETRASPL